MSPRGVPGNVPPSGNAMGRAEFALAMRRLAAVEALPLYAELCAEADARQLAEAHKPRHANGATVEPTEAEAAYRSRGQTHGCIGTYNAGCRCDACREAGAEAKRRQRAKAS